MTEETTTIRIKMKTKKRLEAHGRMDESFDELINRILSEWERGRKQ